VIQWFEVNVDVGTGGTVQGWLTEPAGKAACMTLFMIGPATPAPSDEMPWTIVDRAAPEAC
jgi:hypothetical protein